jgi:hypothetical protein
MRYRTFLLVTWICCLFYLPSTYGQIGIKAGMGASDIVFASEGQIPYLGYEGNLLHHRVPLLAYQVGAFGSFDLSERLDIQPELLFVANGLDYRSNFLYDDVTYKVNIYYLQVPLLLRYKTAVKKNKHSGLYIGPYFSWKLNAQKVTEMEGVREKLPMSNVLNSDLGMLVGYSFDLNRSSGDLVFDFRMGYSLINMMDPIEGFIPWYYGPETERARNVTIMISLGYRFIDVGLNK